MVLLVKKDKPVCKVLFKRLRRWQQHKVQSEKKVVFIWEIPPCYIAKGRMLLPK